MLRCASRRAVFQLARASWGSGAPGAVVRTSADPRPACGGARCGRSPGTAASPARPWRREPAAWSTRRTRARTAGTPSVLRFPRSLPLGSLVTFHPFVPSRPSRRRPRARPGKFPELQGMGWASLPRGDRKLRKCLIKELYSSCVKVS